MIKPKSILQHKLLGTVGIIELLTEDDLIPPKKKTQIDYCLNLLRLQIRFESVFLNKKPNFFIQKTSVKDFIAEVLENLADETKLLNVNIEPFKSSTFFEIDRFYITNALKQLLSKIIKKTSFLKFNFEKNTLIIFHDAGKISIKQNETLIEQLRFVEIGDNEIFFQTGLKIISLFGATITSKNGQIEIRMPSNKKNFTKQHL